MRYATDLDQSTQPSTTGRPAASAAGIWVSLLILYFVWGSTYIGIRVAIETIPPFLMGAIRFLIAGGALLAWEAVAVWRLRRNSSWLPEDLPSLPTVREWRDSAIVGTALLFGGMGFVALGEQSVPAGITAILVAVMPVWVAILAWIFFHDRLPAAVVVGIVIGLVGVVLLVGPVGRGGGLAFDPFGIGVIMLSPLFWAAGSVYAARRATLPKRALTAAGLQMLFGAAALFIGAVVVGELNGFDPALISTRSIVALAYLVLIGSIVGFTTYVWLLRVAPLPMVATYAYVNPVVAFALAAVLLGEPIDIRTVVGGATIVFAVALIVTARSRVTSAADSTEAEPPAPRVRMRPGEIQPAQPD